MKYFWIGCLLAATAVGCKPKHDHASGEAEHGHGEAPPEDEERPGQAVTLWTTHHELFSENEAFVVGMGSKFAAHVTTVPEFRPATSGGLTVKLTQADGSVVSTHAGAPKRPGIFGPVVTPTIPGKCRLTITIALGGAPDPIEVPDCVVFPTIAAAVEALGDEDDDGGAIPFLKEQQWQTDFAMAPVASRKLQPGVRAIGEFRVAAGREANVSAPVAGRVLLPGGPWVPGLPVTADQVLATVVPRLQATGDRASLEAEVRTARAKLAAAAPRLARAERLFKDQLVPRREVDDARGAMGVARARLSGAVAKLEQFEATSKGGGGMEAPGGVDVKAPHAGVIVAASAVAGQVVQEGDALVSIVDTSTVWLEARVFETDLARIGTPQSASFTVPGERTVYPVAAPESRLVLVGRFVDPETRTVPIVFEMANPEGRFRIGQFSRVTLAAGPPIEALAIPEIAVIRDAGRSVVYVQVHGEAFARRPVTLGLSSQGFVEVTDGLKPGEHVVTRGAWDIKLASAAGSVPAHGHAH